MSDQLIAEAAM